jgi:hypothetical protein
MSVMGVYHDQRQSGYSSLMLPLALTSLFLFASLVFGSWAFVQMQDYKNNVNVKVTSAIELAKQEESSLKDTAFVEAEKQPLRTYSGPSAYGSITVNYPKTWSAYIADGRSGSPHIDGYFYPGVVPDLQSSASVYALRIQVVSESYSNVLSQFSSYVRQGGATVSPYSAPKVPSIIGARISGKLIGNTSGTMIVLPLRDTTLKIWTEAPQFEQDFNTNILSNLNFLP